jgi:hypothetical protein
VRLFLLVGAIVTLAPVAFILRSGGGNSVQPSGLPGAAAAFEAGSDSAPATAAPATVPVVTAVPVAPAPIAVAPVAPAPEPVATALTRPSRTTTFECPKIYEVIYGDYWLSIAKVHQVTLDELLAQNQASAEQPLYPGRLLCLPPNASEPTVTTTLAPVAPARAAAVDPEPATTTAPKKPTTTTTAAPTTTTVAPTTTKPTPTTTKPAPTTTEAPPTVHYDNSEIEAIIRAVWPDELEDKALVVANRESTLQPNVRNYCCFGLFQIYYETHKKWLAELGVQSAEDLYDPQVNTYAAYVLYQRAGGWGPWGG